MRATLAAAGLGAALVLVPALAAAQPGPPAYAGDAALYLQRGGALGADPPAGGAGAVFSFGPGALAVRFESPPLEQPWALRGPATFHASLGTTLDVLGRVNATLDLDGVPFADSTTLDLLPDFRERSVALDFGRLDGVVPVGSRVGITVSIAPVLRVGPAAAPLLTLATLQVDLLYGSRDHPSRLEVLGVGGGDGAGGAPGPRGPAGTSPGLPAPPPGGGSGSDGSGAGAGSGLPEPLRALGPAGVDPFLVLVGVGTSAVALLAGLALRGRYGW